MVKKTCLISLFLLFSSTYLTGVDSSENVSTILNGYAKNRDQIKSYIIQLEMDTTFNAKSSDPHYAAYNGTWKEYNMQEIRTDGNRYHLKDWRWGDDMRKGVEIAKDNAKYNSLLYNGDKAYQNNHSTSFPKKPDSVIVYPGGDKTLQEDALCRGLKCHAAFGYFEGDLNTRIDKLLKDSDVKMQVQSENWNGYSCRVVTADTSNGKYKLWFAPEKGYSIVKATKAEKGGDIHCAHPNPEGLSGFAEFEVAKMIEVDGVWIPTEIHFKGKTVFASGDYNGAESVCKINTVNLNPDHELLKSFEIDDIRNGARVTVIGTPGITYTWQDGKLVSNVDKAVISGPDKMTKGITAKASSAGVTDGTGIETDNKAEGATAEEVLNKCTETLDKTYSSFITQANSHVQKQQKFSGAREFMTGEENKFVTKELRTDGDRIKVISQQWGDTYNNNNIRYFRPKSESNYQIDIYDGDKRYEHVRAGEKPGSLIVHIKDAKKSLYSLGATIAQGSPTSQCFGYLRGDLERFDRIIREAGPGKMTVKEEQLNGTVHYVIDAEIDRGKYRIWINPEKGYNFSKALLVKKTGDLVGEDYKLPADTEQRTVIENTEFKKIDGLWVPVKAIAKFDDKYPDGGYLNGTQELELTTIQINPDHSALNSFSLDGIKDGAMAMIPGSSIQYYWRNGELIPK
jgi:hypothetical protein